MIKVGIRLTAVLVFLAFLTPGLSQAQEKPRVGVLRGRGGDLAIQPGDVCLQPLQTTHPGGGDAGPSLQQRAIVHRGGGLVNGLDPLFGALRTAAVVLPEEPAQGARVGALQLLQRGPAR